MTVDLDAKILKQVEFYFGDSNLPLDKFLRERVQENEGGWVPIEVVAKFSRMRALSEDLEVIRSALAKPSGVIVLNEDKTCIRRQNPLPSCQDTIARTLYVKGFPQTATLDELQEFFAQHSQAVQAIRLRRVRASSTFKGSVFLELSTEEEAKKLTTLELTYGGQELIIKTKLDYFREKNAERVARKNGCSGTINSDTCKPITGSLLKIHDCPTEGISVPALKTAFQNLFPIAFADFKHEPGCVWIRFREPCADEFIKIYGEEKPLELGDHRLSSFSIPTEEEQNRYHEAMQKSVMASKKRRVHQSRKRRDAHPDECDDREDTESKRPRENSEPEKGIN